MNILRKTLARRLGDLMDEKNIKQEATRELTGVAQKTISNTKNELTAASIDTLESLATGFKIPAWTLLVDDVRSIKQAQEMDHLLRLYLSSNDVGRSQIIRTAEAESRYSSQD